MYNIIIDESISYMKSWCGFGCPIFNGSFPKIGLNLKIGSLLKRILIIHEKDSLYTFKSFVLLRKLVKIIHFHLEKEIG